MQQKIIKKTIWLKFIPQLLYIKTKNKSKFFIKKLHISYNIINWNLLWFFIFYQLNLIKKIFQISNKILLVSEFKKLYINLKNLANITKTFFLVGPWKNGILTNIYWYKFTPNFIINFGSFYLKNYFTEISHLCIPNLIFFNTKKNLKFLTRLNYFILNLKTNAIYFFFIFFLFAFIFKNYINFWRTEFFQIKKKFYSTIEYLKFFRKAKKKKILFINQTLKKINYNSTLLKNKWLKKIMNFYNFQNINKIFYIFFLKKQKNLLTNFFTFLKLKKKQKNVKKPIKTQQHIKKLYFFNLQKERKNWKIEKFFELKKAKTLKIKINQWINQEFLTN